MNPPPSIRPFPSSVALPCALSSVTYAFRVLHPLPPRPVWSSLCPFSCCFPSVVKPLCRRQTLASVVLFQPTVGACLAHLFECLARGGHCHMQRAPPAVISSVGVPYVPRGNCTEETRRRTPTATCPQCLQVPGAGVCPAPGSVGSLALEFDQVFVLCMGATCSRHRTGYWPPEVHRRLTVFDASDMDRTLSEHVGPQVSRLLHIGTTSSHAANPASAMLRHRVLALLAELQLVVEAQRRGLQSVLILEADLHPLSNTRFELQPAAVVEIAAMLRAREWSVLRLGGQYWHYSWSRQPAACPTGCACNAVTNHTCEIRPPAWGGEYCMVKDTVAFAVHRRAFGAFASARRRALRALNRAVHAETAANGTWGLPTETFDGAWGDLPWFDMWLPATQSSIYVLPSIAVQQIKQGDVQSSVKFAAQCVV